MRSNIACAAILALTSSAAVAADEYRMVDLGSPNMPESHMRPDYAVFAGLSSNGRLAVSYWYGIGDFDFDQMTGRYSDEKGWEYTDRIGCATAINSLGDVTIAGGLVAGQYSYTQRCTVWHADGTFTDLPENLRAGYEFRPMGINASGTLVGQMDQTSGFAPHAAYAATINGLNVDLNLETQGTYLAINDAGYALRYSSVAPYYSLVKPGVRQQVFPNVATYVVSGYSTWVHSLTADLNELNEVAGWSRGSAYYYSPMIYRTAGALILPMIPSQAQSQYGRIALNDFDQLAIESYITPDPNSTSTKKVWMVWTGTKYIDVLPLLTAKAGWQPQQLIDIDNQGRVYASAVIPGGAITVIRFEPIAAAKKRKTRA